MPPQTTVSIHGEAFYLNDRITYPGRFFQGMRVEGLLLNSRMVQGIFDDLNPETRAMWAYPDGPFDAERNTREFIAAMADWRTHGLLAFTLNLQGGSPQGYSKEQPWHNSAFTADGGLRPDYMDRLKRILERADELGMAVILGFFYFGQQGRLADEAAVIAGVDNATDWILQQGYTHVLIEIGNEVDIIQRYTHTIIAAPRGHELIRRVQERSAGRVNNTHGRLLVSTSFKGNTIPSPNVVAVADFLLIHGNGVGQPDRIREMVQQCRDLPSYWGQPILFNEDDHFDFGKEDNNMLAAIGQYASWGFFDYRMGEEGFAFGYQSMPADWGISSDRKRGFFELLKKVTGA